MKNQEKKQSVTEWSGIIDTNIECLGCRGVEAV